VFDAFYAPTDSPSTTRAPRTPPHRIVTAELDRALADPDPLRGIAQLVARWGAAFVLHADGITRTKTLGAERMARKLRDALLASDQPLRDAVWAFLHPVLSPRLAEPNRDAFVHDTGIEAPSTSQSTARTTTSRGRDLGGDSPRAA